MATVYSRRRSGGCTPRGWRWSSRSTAASAAPRRARELGIDLIITDHHEPDAELPAALAVINPKRRDCSYPDKDLAGVGVALKLVQSLCRAAERESWLPGFIKVAAIGTMADQARRLAMELDGENLRRQEEEAEILAAAKKIVQTDPDIGARSVLVVAGEQWHRGVIGIVASKLVDTFYRPAIVLSVQDGIAYGSCRSIPKFDMLGALERCAHLFIRFGGHKQAAGLAIETERIKELRLAGNAGADEILSPEDLMPRLRIDADLTFRGITGGVAAGVGSLAPFGTGNPRPVFAARGVEIIDGPRLVKERHLKMALKQHGRIFRAVAWRAAEQHDYLTEHRAALD